MTLSPNNVQNDRHRRSRASRMRQPRASWRRLPTDSSRFTFASPRAASSGKALAMNLLHSGPVKLICPCAKADLGMP